MKKPVRIAARVGLVELMLSGCSTVADHQYHYYPGMPFDASAAVFDEAERLGLRLVLCRGGQTQSRAMTDTEAPPQVRRPKRWTTFMSAIERMMCSAFTSPARCHAARGQCHHHAQLELRRRPASNPWPSRRGSWASACTAT